MESWVYIFSRFTQEALLFEALLIFGGFAAYAAFYITRRRKFGAAGQEIPSSLVKVYLAQLVADAEEMRNQLFGLLGKGQANGKLFNINLIQGGALLQGADAAAESSDSSSSAGAVVDPKWLSSASSADLQSPGRLKDLEAKMHEQAKALEAVLNEKMRLEEELAVARTRPSPSGGATAPIDESLAEKMKTLEAQLAEYAVIEDDLANLKRLQKENKSLRQQLESARTGGARPEATDLPETSDAAESLEPRAAATDPTQEMAPQSDSEAATPELAPKAAVETPTPELAAKPETVETPTPELAAKPVTPETATPMLKAVPISETTSASGEPPSADAASGVQATPASPPETFDSLVDDVEKSLAQAPDAAQTQKAAAAATTPPGDKSEEELQADFEKMLKS